MAAIPNSPPCSIATVSCTQNEAPKLKTILPPSYGIHVCEYTDVDGGFEAFFRLPLDSEVAALKWMEDFQQHSKVTFRVNKTMPNVGKIIVFKKYFHCQHNESRGVTRSKSVSKKTGCKSVLTLTVKRIVKYQRSKDQHLPALPTCVRLKWVHNHPI